MLDWHLNLILPENIFFFFENEQTLNLVSSLAKAELIWAGWKRTRRTVQQVLRFSISLWMMREPREQRQKRVFLLMVDAQLTAESQMAFEYKPGGSMVARWMCVPHRTTLIIKPRTHGSRRRWKTVCEQWRRLFCIDVRQRPKRDGLRPFQFTSIVFSLVRFSIRAAFARCFAPHFLLSLAATTAHTHTHACAYSHPVRLYFTCAERL